MSKAQPGSAVAVIGLDLWAAALPRGLLAAGHHVVGVTDNLGASASAPERIHQSLAKISMEGLLADPAEAVMRRFLMTGDLTDYRWGGDRL